MAGMAIGATEPEDELKSATVLTFVRHSEWLQDSQSGPITIGVTGRPSMISTLHRALDGKTANNRTIRIVDVKSLATCGHARSSMWLATTTTRSARR